MESDFTNEQEQIKENEQDLKLTPESKYYVRHIIKWGNFIATVTIIGVVFLVLSSLMIFFGIPIPGGQSESSILVGIVYIVTACINGVFIFFWFKYSSFTKRALVYNNSDMLSEGLWYLNRGVTFAGVALLVLLCLIFASPLIGFLVGAAMG